MYKKENMVRSPTCKFLARKSLKQPCLNSQHKPPKCYIKITGSRYNGTFLLNIDNALDDAIYHTMREIEVALESQTDPIGKPSVSPKNCLSSVFRCFGTSELETRAVCKKKKPKKPVDKPAECALTATVNKSELGPLISAVQSNSFSAPPENSSERVMREVVDVFRSTLDQFRRENQSSPVALPSGICAEPNCPSQSTPPSISKTEAVDRKESNEKLKKVSVIKFSQEEVLVIQPPKPSNIDTKQLEVGIEVKPKSTASNVGQSITLAKDKVLIGVQDGRGVLQINDGVPKRSLQMVIEEGVDGKPSMKLSLKEDNDHLEPEEDLTKGVKSHENEKEFPKVYINGKRSANESASIMTNGNENMSMLDKKVLHNSVEHYKSVESQVSWVCLKAINSQASEKQKYKTESTQYHTIPSSDQEASHCVCCTVGPKPQVTVANIVNECTDMSQNTVLSEPDLKRYSDLHKATNSRFNRMPYLVHTLYEPRSLRNSSAYFASDNPSVHFSIGQAVSTKKLSLSKRQTVKKPKSFSFRSDNSSSSKCTKIFRDIKDIGKKGTREEVKPLGKKQASMTASLAEDFEKILQKMCGTSYLYHQPELPRSKSTGLKHDEEVCRSQNNFSASLLFDQWTQTDSFNQEVQCCVETLTKSRVSKNKSTRMGESCDGSRTRIFRKKARRTRSSVSRADDLSISTSGLEDVVSSDSLSSNKHKLVFSMLAASDGKPLAGTSSGLMSKNWVTGKAKSFVGQKIFAAIEDHSNQSEFSCDEKNSDSFIFPACHEASRLLLHGGNTVSVVNMALYDPNGPQLTNITEDDIGEVEAVNEANASEVEAKDEPVAEAEEISEPIAISPRFGVAKPLEFGDEQNHHSIHQAGMNNIPSYPIRVKSKSCQNLSLTPTPSKANVEKRCPARSPIKKLRYPHLTATDSTSVMKVCGILNLNEGGMKPDGHSVVGIEKPNPRLYHGLPSAIRSLLLPTQPSLELTNHQQISTYCCDRLGTTTAIDSVLGIFNQNDDDWCAPYEVYDSATPVAVQSSLFKRTFFAMKTVRTVVTRKFSTIFRKISTHSSRKKMNDSLVYVAIPLKKKSENLHLYSRAH